MLKTEAEESLIKGLCTEVGAVFRKPTTEVEAPWASYSARENCYHREFHRVKRR